MANFDDLRRQAEQHFGKDVVERFERGLQSDNRRKDIIATGNVDFTDHEKRKGNTEHKPKKDSGTTKSRTEYGGKGKAVARTLTSEINQPNTGSHSHQLLNQAVKWEYIYGILGLVLGLTSIIGGIVLGLNGVAGSTSWTAKVLGLESSINDAAPGVVLFIVGVCMVFLTKPKIKMGNLKG